MKITSIKLVIRDSGSRLQTQFIYLPFWNLIKILLRVISTSTKRTSWGGGIARKMVVTNTYKNRSMLTYKAGQWKPWWMACLVKAEEEERVDLPVLNPRGSLDWYGGCTDIYSKILAFLISEHKIIRRQASTS